MQDIKNTPTTENEASQQDSKKDKRQRALRQREAICHQAMELARAGKRILPVGRDKRPLVKDWTQSASSDVKQVKEWWGKLPDANIGLVTGETNGFFVVDLDRHGGPDGVQVFETLCREKGVDIKTHKVGTPSGGQHLYFRYPTDGTKVTNKTSLLPGVDIRGDGGMIIYPPSCNGQGVAYTVLEDAEPAIPPAWLLEMVTSPAPGTPKVADHAGSTRVDYDVEKNVPYLNKVIENAVSQMEAAYTGNRNDTLFKCAVSVAPYIASGQLEELEAFAPLREVAKLKGLDDGEINAVLDSAMKRGKEAPKTAPAPLHSYETAGKRNGDSFYKMPAFPEPPLCCFSDPVAKLLREASETYNVPLAVPVATLLALLSALVGCKRTITPKASWKEAGNLWIAIVAPSGLGKSPLARCFFSPLVKEDHKLFLDWRREMEAYKQNLREYERRKKASKEESFAETPPMLPLRTQRLVEDATPEALADILSQNPEGVLWHVDELAGMFKGFDKYSAGDGGTRERLLSAYDGGKWEVSRKDSSKNLFIPRAYIGIYGGIQPKRLRSAFGQGDKDSGFLQRFVLIGATLDQAPLWNDKEISAESQKVLDRIVARLSEMTAPWEGDGYTVEIPLEAGALDTFRKWYDETGRAAFAYAGKDCDAESSRSMKFRSIALRVCLLLYCLKEALAPSDDWESTDDSFARGPIPSIVMLSALGLTRWLHTHSNLCWEFLKDTKKPMMSPQEKALVESVIEFYESATKEVDMVPTAYLVRQMKAKTNCDVSPQKLSCVAKSLGLEPSRNAKIRGFKLTSSILEKLDRLVNPVITVIDD